VAGAPSIAHPHELLKVPHHDCWLRAMSRYPSELLVTRVPGRADDALPTDNGSMRDAQRVPAGKIYS